MGINKFLSTLPARGATKSLVEIGGIESISIHAPREGSDVLWPGWTGRQRHFYPRSPRGERRTPPPASLWP